MMIQIVSDTRENDYRFLELTTGKHSIAVVIRNAPIETYVRVIVQNAANRAWRGMGKQFPTMADAIANYKTADIKAMLESL